MNKIKVNSKMINSLLGNTSGNSDSRHLQQSLRSNHSRQKIDNEMHGKDTDHRLNKAEFLKLQGSNSSNNNGFKTSKDSTKSKEVDYIQLNKFIDREIKENRLTLEKNPDYPTSNLIRDLKASTSIHSGIQDSYGVKPSLFKVSKEGKGSNEGVKEGIKGNLFSKGSKGNFEIDLHCMKEDFPRDKLNLKRFDEPHVVEVENSILEKLSKHKDDDFTFKSKKQFGGDNDSLNFNSISNKNSKNNLLDNGEMTNRFSNKSSTGNLQFGNNNNGNINNSNNVNNNVNEKYNSRPVLNKKSKEINDFNSNNQVDKIFVYNSPKSITYKDKASNEINNNSNNNNINNNNLNNINNNNNNSIKEVNNDSIRIEPNYNKQLSKQSTSNNINIIRSNSNSNINNYNNNYENNNNYSPKTKLENKRIIYLKNKPPSPNKSISNSPSRKILNRSPNRSPYNNNYNRSTSNNNNNRTSPRPRNSPQKINNKNNIINDRDQIDKNLLLQNKISKELSLNNSRDNFNNQSFEIARNNSKDNILLSSVNINNKLDNPNIKSLFEKNKTNQMISEEREKYDDSFNLNLTNKSPYKSPNKSFLNKSVNKSPTKSPYMSPYRDIKSPNNPLFNKKIYNTENNINRNVNKSPYKDKKDNIGKYDKNRNERNEKNDRNERNNLSNEKDREQRIKEIEDKIEELTRKDRQLNANYQNINNPNNINTSQPYNSNLLRKITYRDENDGRSNAEKENLRKQQLDRMNIQEELKKQQLEHEHFVKLRNKLKNEREKQLQLLNAQKNNNQPSPINSSYLNTKKGLFYESNEFVGKQGETIGKAIGLGKGTNKGTYKGIGNGQSFDNNAYNNEFQDKGHGSETEEIIDSREYINRLLRERIQNTFVNPEINNGNSINSNRNSKYNNKNYQSEDEGLGVRNINRINKNNQSSYAEYNNNFSNTKSKSQRHNRSLSTGKIKKHLTPDQLEQLNYDLNRDYSTLKASKFDKFLSRMEFDILKRHTKDERVQKILEIKKEEKEKDLYTEDNIKYMNQQPDEMTLIQIERMQKHALDRSSPNHLNLHCSNHIHFKGKGNQNQNNHPVNAINIRDLSPKNNWDEIYRDRFMKFESERQRKNRERQREKNELEQQEEEEIVQQIRNKSKVVPKRVAEESGVRMFKEAQRRQNKSQTVTQHIKTQSTRSKGGNNINTMEEYENFARYSKHQPYRFQEKEKSDEELNEMNIQDQDDVQRYAQMINQKLYNEK